MNFGGILMKINPKNQQNCLYLQSLCFTIKLPNIRNNYLTQHKLEIGRCTCILSKNKIKLQPVPLPMPLEALLIPENLTDSDSDGIGRGTGGNFIFLFMYFSVGSVLATPFDIFCSNFVCRFVRTV